MRPTTSNTLVLIPARAGSKGVPEKNSKSFAGGPSLAERAVLLAKKVFADQQIVVSTDDDGLLKMAQRNGVVALKRSPELASDTAGMLEVMLDAVSRHQPEPEYVMLLQPTSPFRTEEHLIQALNDFQDGDQALIAVNEPAGHPFYTLFEEHEGLLNKFNKNNVVRRQDLPPAYDVNGLLYLFKITDLRQKSWVEFERIRPLVVPKWQALDVDTPEDWWLAETLYKAIFTAR
jgi:CMP-N,N'-diacetyllegionaminic acid synthase